MRRNGAASRAHPLCVEDEMSRRVATIGTMKLQEARQQRRRREIRHLNHDARNPRGDDEPGLCAFRTAESRVNERGARSIATVNADGERGVGASASHVCTHGTRALQRARGCIDAARRRTRFGARFGDRSTIWGQIYFLCISSNCSRRFAGDAGRVYLLDEHPRSHAGRRGRPWA